MSEQERIILQYLENSYTGARMLDDISAMTRIARAIAAFEADPTEDIFAAEPRKGEWIEEDIHSNWSDWTLYFCSECGKQFKNLEERNFCPNCGARMGNEHEYTD